MLWCDRDLGPSVCPEAAADARRRHRPASRQALPTRGEHSLNRREFLENSTCFPAALVLGFHWPAPARALSSPVADEVKAFVPNAWLTITTDNEITILAEKPELGQGSWTYTAMMVAEELEADWTTIQLEQAPTNPAIYKGLRTGGSGGVSASFLPLRKVGAQAHEMLRTAGAASWGVPKAD